MPIKLQRDWLGRRSLALGGNLTAAVIYLQ